MEAKSRRRIIAVVALVLPLVVPACGGGGGGGTPTAPVMTPPPTPPPPRVVIQNTTDLPADFVMGHFFTTDRAGVIDATVDYTYSDSDIGILIMSGRCTFELLEADQCNVVADSFVGAKPRRVSLTGAAAGDYTLVVANGGPHDEGLSYQVVLTASAASAAGAHAPSDTGPMLAPLRRGGRRFASGL